MPTLVQRIGRDPNIPADQQLPGHLWEAALELYLNDHLTLGQISGYFNMTSSQEVELSWLFDEFDSRNAIGKLGYFHDLIAATAAFQLQAITEVQFRNMLNLPETSPMTSTTTTTSTTSTTSSSTSSSTTTTTTEPPT